MASKTLLEPIQAARETTQPASLWRLLIVSSAALYLEIVLIRWIGTEVKIFAFVQNLSLIACFLGFGVGCFNARKRGSLVLSLAATSTIVVAASLRIGPWHQFLRSVSAVLSYSSDGALWSSAMQTPLGTFAEAYASSLAIVAMFLLLICIAMIPLGRWVGYYLETMPNTVSAYSVRSARQPAWNLASCHSRLHVALSVLLVRRSVCAGLVCAAVPHGATLSSVRRCWESPCLCS